MIAGYRQAYNEQFRTERYEAMLDHAAVTFSKGRPATGGCAAGVIGLAAMPDGGATRKT